MPGPEAKFCGIFWITLPKGTFFESFFQFLKIDENVHLTIWVSVLYVYGVLVRFEREKRAIQSMVRSLSINPRYDLCVVHKKCNVRERVYT